MADLSRITIKGTTYEIRDNVARSTFDNYVEKVTGKALSTNDFTDAYKTKLDNMTSVIQLKGVVSSVSELPAAPVNGDIYLVGTAAPYTEKIYVESESAWEDLGNVEDVDLSNYTTLAQHQEVTDWVDGIVVNPNSSDADEVNHTLVIPASPTWS